MKRLFYTHDAGRLVNRGKSIHKMFDLSNKEVQILEAMASGITNSEIGKKLFLTEGTVKSYLHRIFQKMDVKSRTQAVMKALEYSII